MANWSGYIVLRRDAHNDYAVVKRAKYAESKVEALDGLTPGTYWVVKADNWNKFEVSTSVAKVL